MVILCYVTGTADRLRFEVAYFLHTVHGVPVLKEGYIDHHPSLSSHHLVPARPQVRNSCWPCVMSNFQVVENMQYLPVQLCEKA